MTTSNDTNQGMFSQPTAEKTNTAPIRNTNRWDTKTLVTMALFAAIGVLLSYIELPLFPPAPWLKFDPSNVVAIVGGFVFGPLAGVTIGLVQNIIHGLFSTGGGFFGALMNCVIVTSFVLPASLLYQRDKTLKTAIIGLVISSICAVIFAILMNIWVTPLFTSGVTLETIIAMIIPILLPFNLIKVVLNSVLTVLIYKPVSNLIKPAKSRKKGVAVDE